MTALPKASTAGSLQDKVVLLVSGSGGRHLSLAVTLAELGADIAIVYSDQEQRHQMAAVRQRVEAADRKCLGILAEVSNRHLPRTVIRQIAAELGRLDIFIDCSKVAEEPTEGEVADDGKVRHRAVRGSHRPNPFNKKPFTNLDMMAAAVRQILENQQPTYGQMNNETRSKPMRVAKELLSTPVYSIKEGRELGKLQDFYLDRELRTVTAVYLGKEGLLDRRKTLVKWDRVVTMGPDAILVDEADAVLEVGQEDKSLVDDYIKRGDLVGRPVNTSGGTKIGLVGDIVIDQEATVVGFSLSQIYVSGPIAANRAISRSSVSDIGHEDGLMTADLSKAEKADLKVVFDGLFADPSVAPVDEEAEAVNA